MTSIVSWLEYIVIFFWILFLSIYTYLKTCLCGNHQRVAPLYDRSKRIAIIGGGIGGAGAAYAFLRSGYKHVTIYEARDQLGGNAKTHVWQSDTTSLTTGLSVLAWPTIFRNYIRLLKELNIPTTTVKLPFYIHHKAKNQFFAHGKSHTHTQQYNTDLQRWDRMVETVRYVTTLINDKESSLYHFSLLNPFNYIPMRLLSLLFGVSNGFWNDLVIPMYASSFLSTKISFIPSAILPVLDDLVSIQPHRTPTLQTWLQTSVDVFDRMTKGAVIKTNCRVQKVQIKRNNHNQVRICIDDNHRTVYDRVVFACNAETIVNTLNNGQTKVSLLLKTMLSNVSYNDVDDVNLLDGIFHRDINILPSEHRKEVARDYANYIDVQHDRIHHLNTFILSAWLPNVHAMLKENQLEHSTMEPMFVTYASHDQPPPKIDPKKIYGRIDNRMAHPSLSMRNQVISLLIRLVQGENGMYFCGNSVTPANGHDLSLLSGFAVAELIGAQYPFLDQPSALRDYNRFKKMCVN